MYFKIDLNYLEFINIINIGWRIGGKKQTHYSQIINAVDCLHAGDAVPAKERGTGRSTLRWVAMRDFLFIGTCHRSPHEKWQRRRWLTLSSGTCGFSIYWLVLVAGYYSTIGPMVLIEKGDVSVNLLFNVSGFGPQLSPQTKSISIHCEIRGPLPFIESLNLHLQWDRDRGSYLPPRLALSQE